MRPTIVEIRVADGSAAWRSAGFAVAPDGTLRVGTTTVRLAEPDGSGPRGITGWTLRHAAVPPEGSIDGLPTAVAQDAVPEERAPEPHPNRCTRIDHVVVMTPDLDRTTEALDAAGIEARRTREAGTGPDGRPRLQRFFRLGEVILEVVGPAVAEPAGGPARFWGLAHEVDDLDATATLLGDRLTPPRPAVQPGRRIAALRRTAAVAVPTAFLTPPPG